MKFELISPMNPLFSTTEQVLYNRNIKNLNHYLNTTDNDINDYNLLGIEKLRAAAIALVSCIQGNKKAWICVDSDCDGFTSAAILINYLYSIFPAWVENYLSWSLHEGKEHGLQDHIDNLEISDYSLVICPDSASNDVDFCKRLSEKDIKVICLDHHLMDVDNPYAIIINNQDKDEKYPNKNMSAAGVVYQFCRYLDALLKKNIADEFLDLCALGNIADVMDTHSIETKHIVNKGFLRKNIKNPFIYNMAEKNHYKLGDGDLGFMAVAFYIAPFVNGMIRSGTMEEKELLFNSMLTFKAFEKVLSTKRGHKLGEMELLVDQAIRTCTNVKNRQGRLVDDGLSKIEQKINDNNLLDHKVLLILLEPGEVPAEIRGLIANKLMSKYQRPCCLLTKTTGDPPLPWNDIEVQEVSYQGSMRGYTNTGIDDFKAICEESNLINYCTGHENAAGLGIPEENIQDFISWTDNRLAKYDTEIKYRVDYIWSQNRVDADAILTIADMDKVWSSTVQEPIIAIQNIKITENNLFLYKETTIKIHLDNVDLMLFNTSRDIYDELLGKEINIVGSCHCNSWNGNDTAQIFIDDYEIIDIETKSDSPLSAWGF